MVAGSAVAADEAELFLDGLAARAAATAAHQPLLLLETMDGGMCGGRRLARVLDLHLQQRVHDMVIHVGHWCTRTRQRLTSADNDNTSIN